MNNGMKNAGRYVVALLVPFAALLLYQTLETLTGGSLPTFVTFYPSIMFVALAAGFWPGLLATVTSALLADYFLIPPMGELAIDNLADAVSLAIFSGMGVFMSFVAERLRRSHYRLEETVAKRTEALRDADIAMENLRKEIVGRKRAEDVAKILAAIVESSDDAIIGKDLDSIITSWNHGAEMIFGFTADEMIGCSIMRMIPAERQEEEQLILEKIKHGEYVQHFKTVRQAKDGHLIDVSVTVSPIKDNAGNIIGCSKVARDITDRNLAEEGVRKLNAVLLDRTAQLETANKELEAFSYSVSHDLRAPLRHITGFVEMLDKRGTVGSDEKSRHYMAVISESAQKMGNLIDDLLSFSRMGRAEMMKTRTSMVRLVNDVRKELRLDGKETEIEFDIKPLPEVYGDPAMLRLVLINLIANAIKFSRGRKPARIEVNYRNDNTDETIFFVRDNGVGFDMKYVDKLFGLFQRLHSPEDFDGTGIGLANVRRIIHRHGGKTWAEGAVDKGATFYFSLPNIQGE